MRDLDERYMQEMLGAMLQGGGPELFTGPHAADAMAALTNMIRLETSAGSPGGALYCSIIGPDDGADVAHILGGLSEDERKTVLATPLSMGLPPLHLACTYASLAAVEAILDAGASIHAPCKSGSLGQSALHVAAVTYRPEVVELLLKRGANPLALDDLGRTPRQRVVQSAGEHALPELTPAQVQAAVQRCTALLEAAEAAAAPQLHRIKKSAAVCDQCGKQESLKRCGGCTLAWYCNQQCAKRAWGTHKQRCKVAQVMRRRLAVLADLSKPAEERWDAMQGITGSNEACLLAGKLSALKLLEPAVAEDKPFGMGPPPRFPQHIPSVRAINEVAWTATLKQRMGCPVPPLVQQFCALGLPERLLERVSQLDVPADTLERTLDVMSQLSLCSCGQALGRQLVECGAALRVVRLLCALPWGAAGALTRGTLGYAADIVGGLLEAERRGSAQQQQRSSAQQQQQQHALTPVETHLLSARSFLESCFEGMALDRDMLCTDMLVFLCTLFGSPAMLAKLLERSAVLRAGRAKFIPTLIVLMPSTGVVRETTPVFISWLAFAAEQRPVFFAQLPSVLADGQRPPPASATELWASLAQLAHWLTNQLAGGKLPTSCSCLLKHLQGVQRNAASLVLAMLRDSGEALRVACCATVTAEQLRAAAAVVERRGGSDAPEAGRLLRQAAELA